MPKRKVSHPLGAMAAVLTLGLLAGCGSSNSGFDNASKTPSAGKTKGVTLTMMIASSGDAETNAVNAAAKAWGKKTGNTVKVTPASNIQQQLTQAMAGGSPPDVFYGEANMFQSLVSANQLAVTGDKIDDPSDFYQPLVSSFTVDGKFYCVPKDFSTLGIQINTDLWKKAGLTDADLPTTWAKLEADAKRLTGNGVTGLVFSPTLDRIGAFMIEAGGSYMNADDTAFTFDSPGDLKGLQFVQKLAREGVLKFPKQVGMTWGGDSLGSGKAAMTIEGNWIIGAMKSDYPKLNYTTVPMPKGPDGTQGSLSFTNCWGIAAKSPHQAAAISFVDYLTSKQQQLTFASTIGVMPSRPSVKSAFLAANPAQKPFLDQASYAVPQITTVGFAQAQQAFDSKVPDLGSSANPKQMLAQLQKNASSLLNK
ncbi:MAG TPA: ABC transporter substrate-binding protein [Nocardioidaceae bacterium]|nr:ABC transporter substrate-binding protein [Nocardioidaceae bacterium]